MGHAGDNMPYQYRSIIAYLIPTDTKKLIVLTTSYEYCKVPGNYIFLLAWGYLAGARVLPGCRAAALCRRHRQPGAVCLRYGLLLIEDERTVRGD